MASTLNKIEFGRQQEALILAELEKKSCTARQLADLLRTHVSSINRYLARLRRYPRRVHIADYMVAKGKGTPLHALGNKPDAVFVIGGADFRREPEPEPTPSPITPPAVPQSWAAALGL